MKKILGITLLLILILSASAAGNTEDYLQGLEHYYNENYEEASEEFSNALSSVQEEELEVDILYFQTLSHIKNSNINDAKENIEKLNDMGYNYGILYWRLGEIYLNKEGNYDSPFYSSARDQFIEAEKHGISAPQFYSDLGKAYRGAGQTEKAIQTYEKAIDKDGTADDFENLGSLYKRKGEWENSISNYQQAIELNSDSSSLYLNIGEVFLELEEYEEAISHFRKGLDLNPDFTNLRYQLGKSYFLNQDLDKAQETLQKVIEDKNNMYNAFYYLGEIHRERDELEQAVYNYEQAL
ncbi:MAG: tetratricopeptide repeat protein, partial [Halanaerobiales bacterium]